MLGQQAHQVPHAVHRDGRVLREKIARVIDLGRFRIDERIVVGAIGLDLDLLRGDAEPVHDRPEKLRQAAQRIAVLNELTAAVPTLACGLVAHQLGTRNQFSHLGGGPHLPRVRLDPVDERRERLASRQHCLRVESMDAERQRRELLRSSDCIRRHTGADTGPVVQRQPLLRLRRQRRQSELAQRAVRIQHLAFQVHTKRRVQSQDRACDVGERHEIATRSDRAALEHVWNRVRVEKCRVPLDDFQANPGSTFYQ